MTNAKVFWIGRSQAVRLPKEFRLNAREVRVRRHGEQLILEQLILEPIAEDWAWLDEIAGSFSEDFMAAARDQPPLQERDGLDELLE